MPRPAFLLFALITVPLIVGCDGCRPAGTNDPNAQEDEKAPEEAYSTEQAIVYPADQSETIGAIKPGHWTTAEQSIRSNRADTRGTLASQASLTLRNVRMEKTGEVQSIETVRPVVLPKGQMRGFDYRFRCPVPNSIEERRISLASRFTPRSGGIMETRSVPFSVLRGSEYFFVVLTNRPERFARLQVANWVRSNQDQIQNPSGDANYRIVIPDADGLISLPETVLDMTSIAVVLWDDLSEDALTPLQRTALSDWIRFGGRLIVNGPDASQAVSNTPLADLLPLMPTSNIELSPDAAVELLQSNSVSSDRSLEKQIQLVRSESSRIAVDGQLDPEARAIEKTSKLVLERRVGRGYIVQPRFDLTDNWIEAWDSYDSFVNSVILDRPPRRYVAPNYSALDEDDAESGGFDARDLTLYFSGTTIRSDAAANTQFRMLSRDSLLGFGLALDSVAEGAERGSVEESSQKSNSPFDSFTKVDAITGISGWTDSSDCISMMRQTLAGEAGIEIPDSSLVVRSLAIYLIVLVPVNFVVFRLMNRLEYAWFAVPLIAVIGAVFAARQARLDIGFARSNTELAVLEVHAGYPRAHLTRMIGIYNSLSDRYTVQFASVDGIASPLEDEPDPNTTVVPYFQTSYEEGPSLADLAINSNRMRYVHTEEICDLGGAINFDGRQTLTNDSDQELLDGICVRKSDQGATEVALVGALAAGESKTIEFLQSDRLMISDELPMKTSRMMRRLATSNSVPDGSCRLVARIDGSVKGLQIIPKASQSTAQTIAVIHLQYPDLPEPKADENLVGEFRRVNRLDTTKDKETQDKDAQNKDARTKTARILTSKVRTRRRPKRNKTTRRKLTARKFRVNHPNRQMTQHRSKRRTRQKK